MYSQILCVLGKSVSSLSQTKNRKLNWIGLRLRQYRELDGIDGEPMIRVDYFPRIHNVADSSRNQNFMEALGSNAEQFQGRNIFMSMYNDTTRRDLQNEQVYLTNSTHVAKNANKFSSSHWSFLGPGSETEWNATDTFKPGREWDRVVGLTVPNLIESGHPIFRATSALERGTLKKRWKIIHIFCGVDDNVELIFRCMVSVNQFSIWEAVADLCEDFVPPKTSTGRPNNLEKSDSTVISADLLNIRKPLLTSE